LLYIVVKFCCCVCRLTRKCVLERYIHHQITFTDIDLSYGLLSCFADWSYRGCSVAV
jgi:hypothetical protein